MKLNRLFLLGLVLAFADITLGTNTLKVEGVEVAPGESVTLSIDLDNETTNLMGWQCDIVLPEGLTLALKANGKPAATLGERFALTEHSISSSRLTNGAYRFIATSMDGEAIPSTSGTLFTVTLQTDISVTFGTTLKGMVKNIEFNTQDNQKLLLNDAEISVTIPAKVLPKCATPTINFENGKLSFSCETEGVKYVYNFSTPSESGDDGINISMPEKLQVSVYAKKDGFENSDVATKEIDLGVSGIRGDLNGDGIVNMPDAMFIINKMLNGKFPDE